MGMDFISAGWTITRSHEPDEEQVKQFLDRLSTEQVLSQIDRLDPRGMYEWDEPETRRPQHPRHRGEPVMAQEVRDTLKFGASVAFDTDSQMSNNWQIPGTTLGFVMMGGGSWGDDPFDGYSAVVMLIEASTSGRAEALTNVICGGLPSVDVIEQYPDIEPKYGLGLNQYLRYEALVEHVGHDAALKDARQWPEEES